MAKGWVRGCSEKVRYISEEQANRGKQELELHNTFDKVYHIYKCSNCNHFHVGTIHGENRMQYLSRKASAGYSRGVSPSAQMGSKPPKRQAPAAHQDQTEDQANLRSASTNL